MAINKGEKDKQERDYGLNNCWTSKTENNIEFEMENKGSDSFYTQEFKITSKTSVETYPKHRTFGLMICSKPSQDGCLSLGYHI